MPITFEPVDPSENLKQGAKLRMMLVGVNEYQDSSLMPLNFAVQDCKKLSEAFHTATDQFPQRRIVTHTDIDAEMPFSIDDLNTSLDRVLEGLTADDTFLFYFSGHGALDKLSQQLYLCLPQTQLQDLPNTGLGIEDLLKRTNASGVGKQVVILDACHSGSVSFPKGRRPMGRQPLEDSVPVSDPTFTPKLEEALKSYKPGSGKRFFALFSCKAEQQSWELPELGHGAFTFHLIQGLRGEAVNDEGCIDSYHLYKYVTRQTNQYVSKRWGRRQDPDQISSGDPNIVLGLGQRSIAPLHPDPKPGEQGMARFENRFRTSVWQLLKEQKDLQDATTRRQVLQAAEKCFLSPEAAGRLETDTIQDFNNVLKRYEERATRRIYECGLRDTLPFDDLRAELLQTFDFTLANLQTAEAEAIAHFQHHKESYLIAFSEEIHHHILSSERHRELRSPLANLGFSDSVIESFEAEAWQALEQHQQAYRAAYRSAIYQHESLDAEVLDQLQQLGLGDRVVEPIKVKEDALCNQDKQSYRQEFAQAIHTHLVAAPVQDRRDLGTAIIDRIKAEETEQCDRHKQEYRQRYAHLVRQQLRLRTQDDHELEQVRQEYGLSHGIVEALEAQEDVDFKREKQSYEDAYCTALHQDQPLSDEGLRAKLNLGLEIIESLESSASDIFEQHRQTYWREYDNIVRQRENQLSSDRYRLNQTQKRLGLGDTVVDSIRQAIDRAVEEDRQNYRAAFDESIRYPEDAIAQERLVQVRQGCNLGEERLQSLENQIKRSVKRDSNSYSDALVTELHGGFPLSLEAQHRLRDYQAGLRLGDAIVAEVTALALQDFERKRAAERRQEEARSQEESRREEEKKQEEEKKREEDKSAIAPAPPVIVTTPIESLPKSPLPTEIQPSEAAIAPSQPQSTPPKSSPIVPPPRSRPNPRLAIIGLGVVGAIGLGNAAYLLWVPKDSAAKPALLNNSELKIFDLRQSSKLKDVAEQVKALQPKQVTPPPKPAPVPTPSSSPAPAEPTYPAPAEPTYSVPVEPAYPAPAEPAYSAPAEPAYPAQPAPAYPPPPPARERSENYPQPPPAR
jgi:hypothetical protein